ncbi:oligosaccharide flippase family protein [Amycolatopsis sp. H20-H5]|uniref:oligosaccharide flippase family protein n=1 Tax=Amycolatopsis sp. H20-H5 TaxID=3046309 RepID=UPI002DBF6F8C|nr:oligosaccharide flippase family protein [Amycolatopsis sp. H20-H5]MEC3977322.1 oligosaccharide flippase family protein [Amycolatopsis sp. H20-H5]
MSNGLGTRAVRGSLWLGVVNLVSKSSQMLVTLVLAALLSEGELGVVALAVSLVNLGQVVQSIGVYDVISRTEQDPRRMAGTVLTMSVGAGVLLAAILALAADPISTALGAPGAAGLVRLAALSLPFSAAGGVQMGLLHRDLDFRRRMLPDGGGAVLGAVVTVVLALSGAGPTSLVVGLLCTAVAQPVFGTLVGAGIRPRWHRGAAREAVRWIAVVGPAAVVAALLVNLDYLAIGHVLGTDAVGVYSLAYRLAWVPYIMVAVVLGAVAFPVFTRMVRAGRSGELPAVLGKFTRAALVVTGGLYVSLAVLSDRVVVLGERWAPAAGPLVLLSGYGLGVCLLQIWYQAVKATGHVRLYLALETTHLTVLVLSLVLLTRFGVEAVAAAQLAAAWVLVPVTWWALARLTVAPALKELAGVAVKVLAAAAAGAVPAVALDRAGVFGATGSLPGALAEVAVLVLGYAGATLLAQRGALGELKTLRQQEELGADR